MRAAGFSHLLTRRNVSKFWSSPLIFGPLVLIVIGVGSSLWVAAGQLHDWYFLCYEFVFMLWPWDYRDRFLIPIVPLACVYLWRGAKAIKNYGVLQPRAAGLCLVLAGSFLCISSAAFAFGFIGFPANTEHVRGDHLQTIAATLLWGALATIGLWIISSSSSKQGRTGVNVFAQLPRNIESKGPVAFRVVAIAVVAVVVLSGTMQVLAIGRYNVKHEVAENPGYAMMQAAEWIRAHEPADRVIMAGEPEFVFHYAERRTVWFPPISDPKVLMDGIRRHRIGAILVVHQARSYWLPPEDVCFQSLIRAYPRALQLAYEGSDAWVYDVTAAPAGPVGGPKVVSDGSAMARRKS